MSADASALAPEQAQALVRDLIGVQVLSCVDLDGIRDLARSIAVSLEDIAGLSVERANEVADAQLAPILGHLPALIQCYVRVRRAVDAEASGRARTRPPRGFRAARPAPEDGGAR